MRRDDSLTNDDCDVCGWPIHYKFNPMGWVHTGQIEADVTHAAIPYDMDRCHICGEGDVGEGNPLAEMYHPNQPAVSGIYHWQCGEAKGLVQA